MVVAVVGYVTLRLLNAGTIDNWLSISSKDSWMMAVDVALFGKTPYVWFSQWGLTNPSILRPISWFYGLYPFLPVAALVWFWLKNDRAQFLLIRRTLLISLYCGYCCYVLIPVSGPLSLMPPTAPTYIESTAGYIFLAGNFRYPFDCFPSLHTANPWLLVWLCRGKLPLWLMSATIFTCCGITLSTVALGVHYGVDDLAGLIWIFPIALIASSTLPRETAS
jgi:membrane-associated phospholipid phosphatase